MRRKKLAAREQQIGQALIEFALVTPALLFITMAIIDFGRVLFTYAQASNQVREALRFGALTQGMAGGSFMDCNGIETVASRVSFASAQEVSVTYLDGQAPPDPVTGLLPPELPDPPAPAPAVPGQCGSLLEGEVEQGDLLEIKNKVAVPMITPFFPTVLEITFAGQRTIVTKITLTESEEDTDFDGLSDIWECYHFAAKLGYDPLFEDADTDICPVDMLPALVPIDFDLDGAEFKAILKLYNATDDPDSDGCNNGCEETRTTVCTNYPNGSCFDPGGTDTPPVWADSERDYTAIHSGNFGWQLPDTKYGPNDPDSDGDGLKDGEEAYIYGSNPLDVDSDDDGWDETACGTAPGCPHNLEPEYTTGGPDGFGCHADDYEEAKGTLAYGSFPAIPPSSSRTAHSDDDPTTLPPEIEDGLDDWQEICQYHTDPSVINAPTDPPSLWHSSADSLCETAVQPNPDQRYIGLGWSMPAGSVFTGFELYMDGSTLIGTFNETATSCTGLAGNPGSCYNLRPELWSAANSVSYTLVPLFGLAEGPASNTVTQSCSVSAPLGTPTLTATALCSPFEFTPRVEFSWTPVTAVPPITNYYFYVNGIVRGVLDPSILNCATQAGPGVQSCFTDLSFNWVVSDSYTYAIQAVRGSTLGALATPEPPFVQPHQCNP